MSLADIVNRTEVILKKYVSVTVELLLQGSAPIFCLTSSLCRYEKFTGDKPERAEKSNDPFTDEYTDLVERINGLTLVSFCLMTHHNYNCTKRNKRIYDVSAESR